MADFEGEEKTDLASLMQVLTEVNQIEDPNYVKVVVDENNYALFFSRSPIPYPRNTGPYPKYYEHIGVYAFRKKALLDFYHSPVTPLEDTEKIECLRYLETGKKIKMVETEYMGIEIDTPEDLENAKLVVSGQLSVVSGQPHPKGPIRRSTGLPGRFLWIGLLPTPKVPGTPLEDAFGKGMPFPGNLPGSPVDLRIGINHYSPLTNHH